MTALIFKLTGGIGLFLLGMVLLTDGIKSFAGESLRRALVRFTGTPLKAFGSGVLVTAMVQSSSATTVTVIGFVSAGLLTFPQTVGVIFGASLGTTGTGWIVSILGLKVSVGFYALPLVGVGAFMKLLAHGRWKALGLSLAGFGLIFVGIETLQEGMTGLSGIFNLSALPSTGFWSHLSAMAIGIVMTVIMQSSSAAVATTLTALHAGAVNFEQAASLVIGAAVGTTVTGALAALAGSVPAKRTALAHVSFNLSTGLIAAILLPLFLWGIGLAQTHAGLEPGATSLAAFHTAFIAVGVAIFLPFVDRFARVIERILPDDGPVLTRHLDNTLLSVPAVALEATRRALSEAACELFKSLDAHLRVSLTPNDARRVQIEQALNRTQEFFAKIPPITEDAPLSQLRVAQMHAIDHLARLEPRQTPSSGVQRMLAHDRVKPAVVSCRHLLELAEAGLHGRTSMDWLERVKQLSSDLERFRKDERSAVIQQTSGDGDPNSALEMLDAIRWLERVGYHSWRVCHYLSGAAKPEKLTEEKKAALDE